MVKSEDAESSPQRAIRQDRPWKEPSDILADLDSEAAATAEPLPERLAPHNDPDDVTNAGSVELAADAKVAPDGAAAGDAKWAPDGAAAGDAKWAPDGTAAGDAKVAPDGTAAGDAKMAPDEKVPPDSTAGGDWKESAQGAMPAPDSTAGGDWKESAQGAKPAPDSTAGGDWKKSAQGAKPAPDSTADGHWKVARGTVTPPEARAEGNATVAEEGAVLETGIGDPGAGAVPELVTAGSGLNSDLHRGEATYSDFSENSGSCGFSGESSNPMIAAMNSADYAGAGACGGCVRIYGPHGSIDVQVVAEGKDLPLGAIDLSPRAFALIAPLESGRAPVTWQYVSRPVSGPVVYHFQDGSNRFWMAVQVRNHRYPVVSLEMMLGGSWIALPRDGANYFVRDTGIETIPLTFRVTDLRGSVLEDSGISPIPGGDVEGTAQFPQVGL